MAITFSKEVEERMIASIKRFFEETMEEEIGDLKASLLLEFCRKEMGPTIYNQAISDAQSHLQDRVADMDGSCFEAEFGYWRDK